MEGGKKEGEPEDRQGVGFLGVGPEKTGTTWLHEVLAGHPSLNLPPYKELSFFWQDRDFPQENALDRLTGKNWHHKRYRRYAYDRLKQALHYPGHTLRNFDRLAWDLRYLLRTHDEDWYLSLFELASGRSAGEISPRYFFLGQPQVEKVHRLCPDAKIIITLREPRAWIWSFVRMQVQKSGLDPAGPQAEAFVDRKIARSSFTKALQSWTSVFPKDQVEVFFYEDVCRQPWELYTHICAFLQIAPQEEVRASVADRFNRGNAIDIPEGAAQQDRGRLARGRARSRGYSGRTAPRMARTFCKTLIWRVRTGQGGLPHEALQGVRGLPPCRLREHLPSSVRCRLYCACHRPAR